MASNDRRDRRIEDLLRALAPQVLGAVTRRHRDFSAAEDAVQEALLAAATTWPKEGTPHDARAWLIRVASRRVIDQHRSDAARHRREDETAAARGEATSDDPSVLAAAWSERDDTLALFFMCCHPALTPSSAIALTLRAVGGLTTAEIASAFFVPEPTMSQRIRRAKQTLAEHAAELEMPTPKERAARLSSVLHVLYLIFNEGYASSAGAEVHRTDLSNEAIRLARAMHGLLPDDAEVAGLLALMLLTDARRPARVGGSGELVPLGEQDRTRWDRARIDEGVTLITATLPKGAVGPYQLQAAIAALHDEAPNVEATDWPQILALYGLLRRMTDNPMVALSEAIAAAMVHGPETGLKMLDALDVDGRLRGHHRLDAVRGHLLERAGDRARAIEHYRAAATRTSSLPERDHLLMRAAKLAESR